VIDRAEVTELLQALIRNACVNDGTLGSGQERRSVETLVAYFGERGTEFEPQPGRVSTLYRVPGTRSGAPSLMLMGHLDVVPVTRDAWSRDPFAGEIHDGFVWGRGAVDMLNQTTAMATVFRRYLTGELSPLPGDLLFLAVADEEAGGVHGARWLVDEHWDAVACDYQLTEIGTPHLPLSTRAGLPITVAEKGPQWRRVRSAGIPGHGSQPYRSQNALVPLAAAIAGLSDRRPPAWMSPEWLRFVEAWAPDGGLADELVDAERVDAAIARLAETDLGLARWIDACTHLTVSPNTLHAGVKANVIPDEGVAEIDIRVLPGQDEQHVDDYLNKAFADVAGDLDLEVVEASNASGSAPEGPLWEALAAAITDVAPGSHPVPAMIPVGTDARFFRRRGTVAYGVGLFDSRVSFGDFLRMFHGHDERVSIESLDRTAALTARTVQEFGRLTD
jgi:acetylornithine deacetylase/succinyl-diaminopimelate desuccinylase-like protein